MLPRKIEESDWIRKSRIIGDGAFGLNTTIEHMQEIKSYNRRIMKRRAKNKVARIARRINRK